MNIKAQPLTTLRLLGLAATGFAQSGAATSELDAETGLVLVLVNV